MSLPKLTSLSTQTLTLLLERQRLQTLPSFSSTTDAHSTKSRSHLSQISQNLNRLRTGILEMEAKEGRSEANELLRSQYRRMRDMLGEGNVERYDTVLVASCRSLTSYPFVLSLDPVVADPPASSSSSPPIAPTLPPQPPVKDPESFYAPYTDDPEAGYEPGMMLQTQRRMMSGSCELTSSELPQALFFYLTTRTRRTS
jgi:syntaxin 8